MAKDVPGNVKYKKTVMLMKNDLTRNFVQPCACISKSASDNEVNTVTRLLRGKFRPFRSVYSTFFIGSDVT